MLDDFKKLREFSQGFAETCAEIKPQPFADPVKEPIDSTVRKLSHLYNRPSKFALRYPDRDLKVPYPQPLLWVLAELVLHDPLHEFE